MILITLGTQDKPFDRLLKEVEKQIEIGNIKEEVIVQSGYTKYKSKNMKIFKMIPRDEMENLIKKCSFIITHGGVGSILLGLKHNKKIIATPRLIEFKEHTNNHQIQIIESFKDLNYIIPLLNIKDLEKTLQKIKNFKPNKFQSNNENFKVLIKEEINKL